MITILRRPTPKNVKKSLTFLLSSQFWELVEINNYQLKKIQSLIKHAYEYIPYYRRIFQQKKITPDRITNLDAFKKIPILTKKDIQQFQNDMLPNNFDRRSLSVNSTGGSTGMPLNFYQDESYLQWSDAARLRAWKFTVGATEKDLEAVFWGAYRDIGSTITLKKMLYYVLREGILPLNTFDLDEKILNTYLSYYNFFSPPIVRGYASSLYYIARYIENKSIKVKKPQAIISSTEILHTRMRQTIERVFECKVFDSYGCREVSQIATECSEHNGLHIVFENQYVELDGQDILITNLNNFIMPFIRYKVGDLAVAINTSPCPCGRFSPRIESLIGRDNDNIELPNGKVINGEFFEFLFFGMSSVIQYQIIYYKGADRLEIKLQQNDSSENVWEMIKKTMAEKFNYYNVYVSYTDKFDKTPTGKLRFVYMVD